MAKSKYESYSKEQLLEKIKQLEKHRYGLVWEDKLEDVAEDCEQQLPVLHEEISKDISSDESKPNNILIEGDNYHALYTLNFTHKRKVDVIYIDPPYNTGKENEWKYNDKWVDSNDRYRHSKWLSFISKRITLAKYLLKDDGVIFISIDDNEIAQLKMLCDKIFNESNFVGKFIRKTKSVTSDVKTGLNIQHEYCLIYAKNKDKIKLIGFEKTFSNYSNPDNDPRGEWTSSDPTAMDDGRKIKNVEPIENPYTGKIDLPGNGRRWRFNQDGFIKLIKEKRIIFKKKHKKNERGFILKRYKNEILSENNLAQSLLVDNIYLNQAATKELALIFGSKKFDFPKPVAFIKDILLFATLNKKNSIVLDFFAGSGTTGHAVLELNEQDGGNRQFILCTNNENKICEEVTYPRIKKVIMGYNGNKGISANLKYFKTDFVPQVITDNDKRILVNRCTELLCIAENTFQLVKQSKRKLEFAIFKSTKQITAIIYDEDAIEKCKEELEELKPKVKVVIYVFSYDHEYNVEDFEDLIFRYDVKPIPEAILNVYRKNAKLKRK